MSSATPNLSSLRINRDDPPPRPRGGTWVRALIIGLLFAVAAFLALRLAADRARPVSLGSATATGGGTVSAEGISANGYVVARTKASVSAKISGRLEYLGVAEGSHVKRDEVIARLESGDYAAQLAAASAQVAQVEAQLAQSRRELKRAQELRRDDLNSTLDLETAETNVEVLEAQLKSAQAQERLAEVNLENTRVRAPFDGTVLRKDAEVGEIVAPSSAGGGLTRTAIVTMADLSTLEVEVDVNEAYIAQVRNGQPARMTLDAYPDTSFRGAVRQVVPTADRQKATVLVKVSILDRDPRILPEMGAKVVFLRGGGAPAAVAPRRVTVPKEAVAQRDGRSVVWVVTDGVARATTVELGPEHEGVTEIRNGLQGGESIVLSPPPDLKDGARVRAAAGQ
ncbi:MAG TPA: efflux RND transporter periplasmic adaptor subunit [Candidatus Sulfotelmatobacter sp.]|nr:efflux RND transporter periplasmic adaptor subunit [Candidatus Sulfotelmatobacter sp.]